MNFRSPYRGRAGQYILVGCALAILFWFDYMLLVHAIG